MDNDIILVSSDSCNTSPSSSLGHDNYISNKKMGSSHRDHCISDSNEEDEENVGFTSPLTSANKDRHSDLSLSIDLNRAIIEPDYLNLNDSHSLEDTIPYNLGDSRINLKYESRQKSAVQSAGRLVHSLSDDSEDEIPMPSWYTGTNRIVDNELIGANKKCSLKNLDGQDNQYNEKSEFENLVIVPRIKRPHTSSIESESSGRDDAKKCNKATEVSETLSRKELAEIKRNTLKVSREKKKEERLVKLAEQAQTKATKLAEAKLHRAFKPGECLKYLTAVIDTTLFAENFGGDLSTSLETAEVNFIRLSQVIPMTITWRRTIPTGVDSIMKTNEEDHIVLVMVADHIMEIIKSRSLHTEVQVIQAMMPDKKLSLLLYGTEIYFKSMKKGTKAKENMKVLRQELLEALVETQIIANCGHRYVESSLDIATVLGQFSKSIAEIPHKLEKSKKDSKLSWYAEGDNHDCVRVDKNGLGLLRLWQQQLCEFHLAGLQTAEAIASVYPSPQSLFQAYSSCNDQRGRYKLLQDIPVRRGIGPLASARRIGPQMSKKVGIFFTALDGDEDLSQE